MFANAPRPFWKWPKEKQSIHIFNKSDWCTKLSFLCLISGNRQFSINFQAAAREELQADVIWRLQNSARCQFHTSILLSSIPMYY